MKRTPAEWPVLAGVRFLLALGVANCHLLLVYTRGGLPLLDELGPLGCICGFLVISGYSIAHSISTQPRGFFRRRAWRVLPVYFVTMLLALLPYLLVSTSGFRFPMPGPTASEVFGSLLLLQCFLTDKIPIFGPSWTLAIEWWFYALAPLFIRARPWMLVALMALSLACEAVGLKCLRYPIHEYRYGIPALMLLWAWLSGFVIYRHRPKGWKAAILVLVGTVAVGRFPGRGAYLPYVIAAIAVLMARRLQSIGATAARFLNYLGDLSYPLYLVHVPLMVWASRCTPSENRYFYLGLALLGSAGLYHGIDKPLRARFSFRRG